MRGNARRQWRSCGEALPGRCRARFVRRPARNAGFSPQRNLPGRSRGRFLLRRRRSLRWRLEPLFQPHKLPAQRRQFQPQPRLAPFELLQFQLVGVVHTITSRRNNWPSPPLRSLVHAAQAAGRNCARNRTPSPTRPRLAARAPRGQSKLESARLPKLGDLFSCRHFSAPTLRGVN